MPQSFFKAIADPNRRKILTLLRREGTLSAGDLAKQFEISLPGLSEHLKVLREAGLVSSRKEKQFVYYTLNTTVFEDVIGWFTEVFSKKEVKDGTTEKV